MSVLQVTKNWYLDSAYEVQESGFEKPKLTIIDEFYSGKGIVVTKTSKMSDTWTVDEEGYHTYAYQLDVDLSTMKDAFIIFYNKVFVALFKTLDEAKVNFQKSSDALYGKDYEWFRVPFQIIKYNINMVKKELIEANGCEIYEMKTRVQIDTEIKGPLWKAKRILELQSAKASKKQRNDVLQKELKENESEICKISEEIKEISL